MIAPTFRDPDGCCFSNEGRVLRIVYPHAADRVRRLLESTFLKDLMAEKLVPATRVLSADEIESVRLSFEHKAVLCDCLSAVTRLPSLGSGQLSPEVLVLEHERIDFVSYAHEWCPEMLHSAADLTLRLQLRALAAGFTLKDATPTNILFRGPKPVFIDLLSFVPREKCSILWLAYAQFVRTFLLPLLVNRHQGLSTHELFFTRRDGLEPAEVYSRLSIVGRFSLLALQYAALPTWCGQRVGARSLPSAPKAEEDDARSVAIAQMMVHRLKRHLFTLRPSKPRSSMWINYVSENIYSASADAEKEAFVRAALSELSPRTVLDVGCNTGKYARIAAMSGASVIAIDSDPAVVGKLLRRAQAEKDLILPLIVNLARPSPALGWENQETSSFLTRVQECFDAVLLLAVVHHLTISEGIPLRRLFRMMANITRGGLVVEYVSPSDPMCVELIRNKGHLPRELQRAEFEAAFGEHFSEVRHVNLSGSGRTIYLLRKLGLIGGAMSPHAL